MAITLDATNSKVINAVRAEMMMYGDRIPEATQANLSNIAGILSDNRAVANEFLGVLVNRIARVVINSRLYENPLASFKKGSERYGDVIEEIFINLANAHEYDPVIAEKEVYKREIPDLSAAYHRTNSKLFYKTTIQENDLYQAVINERGFQSLVARIVDTLYSGANYDEFIQMKELFAANKNYYSYVKTDAPSKTTATDIVTNIKAASNMLTFMNTNYNRFGVKNFTPRDNQVLLLRADVDALIDVNVLASAFNMSKAEFMGRRIIVDDFGTGMDDVYAILCDDTFLIVENKLDRFTENFNGEGLYWNYFWHVWRIYGVSPFANAIAFTTVAVTDPTAVTIAPSEVAEGKKGDNVQFTATATPGNAPQSVAWSADGMNGGSYITATGFLHIGEHQNGDITVKATSIAKNSISKTASVTVT